MGVVAGIVIMVGDKAIIVRKDTVGMVIAAGSITDTIHILMRNIVTLISPVLIMNGFIIMAALVLIGLMNWCIERKYYGV